MLFHNLLVQIDKLGAEIEQGHASFLGQVVSLVVFRCDADLLRVADPWHDILAVVMAGVDSIDAQTLIVDCAFQT